VGWLACLLSAMAVSTCAADGTGAAPAPVPGTNANIGTNTSAGTSTTTNTATSTNTPADPAPLRSTLDSEPIRRRAPDNGGQTPASGRSQGMELSRVGMALAVVIALILLLRWGGKKLFQKGGMSRSTRAVQVLARAPLAPRQHIVLVRVGRRVLVVGECGSQMNPLCEITDGDEIAALLGQLQDEKLTLPGRAFNSLFQRARGAMGGSDAQDEEESAAVADAGAPAPEAETEPAAALESPDEPAISETRNEITGLMAKIRVLSSHFRDGAA
jgi:flagellar biosynthetic protein FliO